MEERTIICRCEDLTLGEIRELIARGFHTIDEIKRVSRAGMGQCQGRTCRMLIAAEIAKATGRPLEEIMMPTFRPPAKGIKLGILAEGGGCDG
ncbi:MAG: (2Fe-2S)-binding protein [Clostridia bacterium]|nr:(2Fe-2S)-binding protein [Clostridia bacterium]